jgi:DNA-binding Lrp family transcriptional regulator
MVAKKQFAPELIAEAKRLYEQTLAPVRDIAAMLGLSRTAFDKRVKEWTWRGRRAKNGAFELALALSRSEVTPDVPTAPASAAVAPVSPQQRAALAARIQSVVEREMTVIERAVGVLGPSNEAAAERTVRTLACISRTLREIAALNQPEKVTPPDEADDDPHTPRH